MAMRRYTSVCSAFQWVTNGQRVSAAGDRLQDRRLDLEKAALVERRVAARESTRSGGEVAALRGVAQQVEVALAVARLLVLESVELLGRRVQRLDEQRDRVDENTSVHRAWCVSSVP